MGNHHRRIFVSAFILDKTDCSAWWLLGQRNYTRQNGYGPCDSDSFSEDWAGICIFDFAISACVCALKDHKWRHGAWRRKNVRHETTSNVPRTYIFSIQYKDWNAMAAMAYRGHYFMASVYTQTRHFTDRLNFIGQFPGYFKKIHRPNKFFPCIFSVLPTNLPKLGVSHPQ